MTESATRHNKSNDNPQIEAYNTLRKRNLQRGTLEASAFTLSLIFLLLIIEIVILHQKQLLGGDRLRLTQLALIIVSSLYWSYLATMLSNNGIARAECVLRWSHCIYDCMCLILFAGFGTTAYCITGIKQELARIVTINLSYAQALSIILLLLIRSRYTHEWKLFLQLQQQVHYRQITDNRRQPAETSNGTHL